LVAFSSTARYKTVAFALSVAKNGSSLGNNRYFSANRTKVELLAVFLIMATNSVEFNVDGVLSLDDLESW
jgi:hypothetical protein